MKKILLSVISSLMVLSPISFGEDWDGIPVPVNAGDGMSWQLQDISDSFNYSANPTNKPSRFTNKWKDTFINPWTGPGLTEFTPNHSSVSNGNLLLDSSRKGSNQVFTGIISSKSTYRYPLYIEARAKTMDSVLANAFWLLSPDSTQEIDVMESYNSSRPGQEWFAQRMHLSHHVFVREPFQDYQPRDLDSWHFMAEPWNRRFHRYGVYWRDPWHLEYYIDGRRVRTVSGRDIIDPYGYTNGTGLNKAMHIIFDAEDQDWRSDEGLTPTNAELADQSKSIFRIDWLRVYKPVRQTSSTPPPPPPPPPSGGDDNGGNSGTFPSGTVSLKVRSSNRCLDLKSGSSANGANIQQWSCGSGANRDFRFISKGGGWYEIRTRHNKCISVAGNSSDNGTNLQQWDCFNANNFQFRRVDRGSGWFELRARHSGKCMDVAANSRSNGGNIHQWQCHGRSNQQFRIE